jgi:hypothetical protein
VRLNLFDVFPIRTSRPVIHFYLSIGVDQNVFPVDFVVELVKALVRLIFRLPVQLSLKNPDLSWWFQTHVNHLSFPSSKARQK